RKYGPHDLPELVEELAEMKAQNEQLEQDLRRQSDDLKAHYQKQDMPVPETTRGPAAPPRALLDMLGELERLGELFDQVTLYIDLPAIARLAGETEPIAPATNARAPASHAQCVQHKPDLSAATAWTQEPAFQRQMRSMK